LKLKILIIIVIAVVVFGSVSYYFALTPNLGDEEFMPDESVGKLEIYTGDYLQKQASQYFKKSNTGWIELNATSVFKAFVKEGDYKVVDGRKVYNQALFELDSSINYTDAQVSAQDRTIVVYPIFTATAYSEPGFYTFYRDECGQECLTVEIKNNFPPQANPNAVQVLSLLGYEFITDIDIDRNPEILNEYDKVIILHNEYVTKKEFDAITGHPHVIYLYPNALYAEVKMDYSKNTITLLRGHNYPDIEIKNGFDWKNDNTPFEYEQCKEMSFYRVENGWMLNCYPENPIYKSLELLKTIKKL
jgi:hypothetical protein